ncbi:MAG: HAMP domain-containing protein, partial [Acidobacteriaceae bacterium]|nr:HAMP domain-containing protein [Acidobacteriaceae bacterium]
AVWYAVVLSLSLILFSCTVWLALRQDLFADLSATLLDHSRGLDKYLRIEDPDQLPRLAHEIDEYSQSLPQDHVLAVVDADGQPLYSNAGPSAMSLANRLNRGDPAKPQRFHWKNRSYLGVSRTVTLKHGTVYTFLAISSEATDRPVALLGLLLGGTVPLFVLGAIAGGYWLSRRALAPVDSITERARTISVSNLSGRLTVPDTHDELQRLTETWNGMLGRIETAFSRISRFTADASHELRTPVAIIRLAAENALRKTRPEAEYRAALLRIQRESEKMTRLIEDLLFLARADVQEPLAAHETIELQSVVESVCVDLAPLAAQRGITLGRKLPNRPVTVLGDDPALRRMLLILLDNAIKYTPGGGQVSIVVERADGHAVLRVEDTGIGIPEEAKARLFQRFFRVDPSRNKESGGYGLGLAIAHAIVQQHQASIRVETKIGGGCIFSVWLPAKDMAPLPA